VSAGSVMLSGAFSCSACESGLSGRNLLDKLGMHCLNVFRECCFEDRDPDTAVEIRMRLRKAVSATESVAEGLRTDAYARTSFATSLLAVQALPKNLINLGPVPPRSAIGSRIPRDQRKPRISFLREITSMAVLPYS